MSSQEHGQSRSVERERDNLAAAIKPLMGTLNYYIGPGARVCVSRDQEMAYWRLWLALNRARGEACPRCGDTGRDKHYVSEGPCALAEDAAHA